MRAYHRVELDTVTFGSEAGLRKRVIAATTVGDDHFTLGDQRLAGNLLDQRADPGILIEGRNYD